MTEDISKALASATLKLSRIKADSTKKALEEGAKMAREYVEKEKGEVPR